MKDLIGFLWTCVDSKTSNMGKILHTTTECWLLHPLSQWKFIDDTLSTTTFLKPWFP